MYKIRVLLSIRPSKIHFGFLSSEILSEGRGEMYNIILLKYVCNNYLESGEIIQIFCCLFCNIAMFLRKMFKNSTPIKCGSVGLFFRGSGENLTA